MSRSRRVLAGWGTSLVLAGILAPALAGAGCQDDSDCKPGTRCLFARHRAEGICASWSPPFRLTPETGGQIVPLHQRGGAGYPCQFTQDCLPGHACYKLGHHLEGQCFE